ncbi:MAG: hypothetical protein QXG12_02030 [Thermoproteota archaeon]
MTQWVSILLSPPEARKELKEEAKRLGIDVSTVLKRRLRKLLERLDGFDDVLDRIDVEEFTRLVREEREKR